MALPPSPQSAGLSLLPDLFLTAGTGYSTGEVGVLLCCMLRDVDLKMFMPFPRQRL